MLLFQYTPYTVNIFINIDIGSVISPCEVGLRIKSNTYWIQKVNEDSMIEERRPEGCAITTDIDYLLSDNFSGGSGRY